MNLLDRPPDDAATQLAAWLAQRGEPPYRVRQILPRLWRRPVATWSDASELPIVLRQALTNDHPLPRLAERTRQVSQDGTVKFLWELPDGELVESVLIPEGRRRTLCISSQSGCAYGCAFCATGRMGFVRHLVPWEIASQVRELYFRDDIVPPTNVVFMGMGEPLHNWSAVDVALTILNHPQGLGIGARHITVSTIGIIPNLERLAARPEQFRIAFSLHAAIPARRRALMPVEQKYPMAQVVETLRGFPRRVTLEYVMIAGLNDGDDDARALAAVARNLGAHVNLLPLHPGGDPQLRPTTPERGRQFAAILRNLGANATVRRSRGLDITAACGQLRISTVGRDRVVSEQHAHVEQ